MDFGEGVSVELSKEKGFSIVAVEFPALISWLVCFCHSVNVEYVISPSLKTKFEMVLQ